MKKVMFIRHPEGDNYVDKETFLSHMVTNGTPPSNKINSTISRTLSLYINNSGPSTNCR